MRSRVMCGERIQMCDIITDLIGAAMMLNQKLEYLHYGLHNQN